MYFPPCVGGGGGLLQNVIINKCTSFHHLTVSKISEQHARPAGGAEEEEPELPGLHRKEHSAAETSEWEPCCLLSHNYKMCFIDATSFQHGALQSLPHFNVRYSVTSTMASIRNL